MKPRTLAGILLSIGVLLAAGVLLARHPGGVGSLRTTEWAELLAGLTAPLAFIWLVIGYFQQGEELRLNTEALRLQYEELRKQVEETAALVRQSERQATAATDMYLLERQQVERLRAEQVERAAPFLFCTGSMGVNNVWELRFKNTGGMIHDVSVESNDLGEVRVSPNAVDTNGELILNHGPVVIFPVRFTLRYTDRFNDRGEVVLLLKEYGNVRQLPRGA